MSHRKYAVRLLRLAEDDLNDIVTFIATENRAAAEALASRIEDSLSHLANYPYLGKIPIDEELIRQGYRYLVVDNYLIFYTIAGRLILVHRIIHGARDYKPLL